MPTQPVNNAPHGRQYKTYTQAVRNAAHGLAVNNTYLSKQNIQYTVQCSKWTCSIQYIFK
jgi:hypothetical protein